ncbi:PP2C family protein-serine/threonine phosphatase [Streptomyces rimosus]|uniref:PP2C family protein-serine/threonine phosphatase n=1 Tax=Streptomyces rimosus TaxID=1927 RepID=UPI001F45465F|nr:PP2C family protein-serine/threonine phosphatase [Streptomyces rimosus]
MTTIQRSPARDRGVALLLVTGTLAITLADAVSGPQLHFALFMGIAPLIAALRCAYRWTAAVAAVYVLCQAYIHARLVPDWSLASKAVGIFGVALVAVFALVLCRTRLEREALYARTSMVADAVQREMLRELPLTAGPLEAYGFYVSAQEGARVGGDIYEAVQTPHGLRLVIGDVQGKGMPAIGAGHEVLASFREAAHYKDTLEAVAERMEQALSRYNARSAERGGQERFVTALLLEVRGEDGTKVLSCGHIPYYLVRNGQVTERTDGEGGLPLGLGWLTGEARQSVAVEPVGDDWIVLCTDGVTEARGADGTFYPLADRLARWTHLEPDELARTLRADLERFTGGQLKDDATVLIVRRSPHAVPRTEAEAAAEQAAPDQLSMARAAAA